MAPSTEERQRIDALKRFFVLDHTPSEDELGRIVRFAAGLFDVSYAFITLRRGNGADELVASYGFEIKDLPEGAILFERQEGPSIPLVIENAASDPRFGKNPLVHQKKGARLYASVPLKSAEGFTLGTLAVMDRSAQSLNSTGMAMLADIGALVDPVLQLHKIRSEDGQTAPVGSGLDEILPAVQLVSGHLLEGLDGFASAMQALEPAFSCKRAALLTTSGEEDQQALVCLATWHAEDFDDLATVGSPFTLDDAVLSEATANNFAPLESSQVSIPGSEHLAFVNIGSSKEQTFFLLLDRSEQWTPEQLSLVRLAFASFANNITQEATSEGTGILSGLNSPVLIVDAEGQIVYANAHAAALFGIDDGANKAYSIQQLASPKSAEIIAQLLDQSTTDPQSLTLTTPGGPVDALVHPAECTFDEKPCTSLVIQDVTEITREREQLTSERDEAVRTRDAKSAFLASMSHEIRTSLTSILGYAEFLVDELTDDELEMAETILGSSERLLQTLNSVMDMERLESAGDNLELEPVSLETLVEETIRVFEGQAKRKGLSFVSDGTDVPSPVWADEGGLTRVLDNLVSNALKFTHKGGVRIRIQHEDVWTYLDVQDTGDGIEESFIPHLFDKFRREKGAASRSSAGSGLGLSLTKRLVELMNGQITVTSRKNQGSVFRVALRRAPAPALNGSSGDGIAFPLESA